MITLVESNIYLLIRDHRNRAGKSALSRRNRKILFFEFTHLYLYNFFFFL